MAARLGVIAGHCRRTVFTNTWASHSVKLVPKEHLTTPRSLAGKTLFITGASRGIGLAIALRAAKDGANVVVAAKTDTPNPKLPGTIHSAAEEIEKLGGKALAVVCDVRSEESVRAAVESAVAKFGGIDILVNNASAINLADTASVDMKRYDLMHSINTRGTFLCTKICLPYLKKSSNPHVLNLSPPVHNLDAKWFGPHVAYTMAKWGMSMCVLGHSEEFKPLGIAVNALWPRTTIATAAVNNLLGGSPLMQRSRTPEIMGDAAWAILTRKSPTTTGNFFVDDEVLASEGVRDFSKYRVDPALREGDLMPDFFV